VKNFGAAHAIDYNDPNVIETIKKIAGGDLYLAYDSTGTPESTSKSFEALAAATEKTRLKHVTSTGYNGKAPEGDFKLTPVALGTAYGNPAQELVLEKYLTEYEQLLTQGKLKPVEYEVLPKGLDSVIDGFRLLLDKKVSGKKLVVVVSQN